MLAALVGLVRLLDERGAGLAQLYGADGVGVLSDRATMLGLPPSGRTSCGGAARLLPASDEWIAVTLARRDDVQLLPAWLGVEPSDLPGDGALAWPLVAERVALRQAAEIVELGLCSIWRVRWWRRRPPTRVAGRR